MTEPTLKIGTTGYKLNPEKLVGAPQSVLPYILGCFYFKEEYEYFDVIKPYLDIPEPPKSLEEISQEFDEKIDDLIERTKNNFYKSKYIAETLYETKFNRIIENFEYAKEHGQFPQKSILTYSTSLGTNNITSSFIIKQGNKHEGYYTIGNGYLRFYMPYKPNAITRWFMNKCLSIRWVDEKND
jgi:hypothetical protein